MPGFQHQLARWQTAIHSPLYTFLSLRWCSGKESTCQYRRCKIWRFDPWVGKITWRRAWQPTLVFLPRESHGQRNLVGYTPWGHKELDTTEHTCTYTHTHTHTHTSLLPYLPNGDGMCRHNIRSFWRCNSITHVKGMKQALLYNMCS